MPDSIWHDGTEYFRAHTADELKKAVAAVDPTGLQRQLDVLNVHHDELKSNYDRVLVENADSRERLAELSAAVANFVPRPHGSLAYRRALERLVDAASDPKEQS